MIITEEQAVKLLELAAELKEFGLEVETTSDGALDNKLIGKRLLEFSSKLRQLQDGSKPD